MLLPSFGSAMKVFTVELPAEWLALCTNQGQEREYSSQPSVMHTLNIYQVAYGIGCSVTDRRGIAGLFFVEPTVKVNEKYYWDVLLWQQMLPASDMWVTILSFSRTVHQCIGHATQSNCYSVKLLTISRELWPSNSPDTNPVDNNIWGIIQQRMYETRVNDVDELKQLMIDVWSGLQQSIVDAAVSERRKCLLACVHTKGGHLEHLL